MAITLNSNGSGSNKTAGTSAVASAIVVAKGDIIIANVATLGASLAAFINFSDSIGTTYSLVTSTNGSTVGSYFAYGTAPSASSTNVVSASWTGGGPNQIWGIIAAAFTGWSGNVSLDPFNTNSGTGTGTATMSGTTSFADGLWVIGSGWNGPVTNAYTASGTGVVNGTVTRLLAGTSGQGASSNVTSALAYFLNAAQGTGSITVTQTNVAEAWNGGTFYDQPAAAFRVQPVTSLQAVSRASNW